MAWFAYQARTAQGELHKGRTEGGTSADVATYLMGAGLIPLDIRELPGGSGAMAGPLGRSRTVSPVELQLFSRQLHTLLRAGVPIIRAIGSLRESCVNAHFSQVLADIADSLGQGRELSASLARHGKIFDGFYLAMIRVGEATGRLDEVFDRLAVHLDADRRSREKVKTALRYPVFVVLALLVAMGVINLFVIPAFAKVYAGMQADLPLMTRILVATSDFTRQNLVLLLAGMAGTVLGLRWWAATDTGGHAWDRHKLRLPVVGRIIHKAALARFARSFALAMRSGLPILQVLAVVGAVVGNRYLAARIHAMREGIERGESLLRTATVGGMFTPVVLQMLAVGEETAELDRLMHEIAVMYEQEVEYDISTLSQQIEPILVVMLGAMVLVLALGVFMPVWDLGSKTLGH